MSIVNGFWSELTDSASNMKCLLELGLCTSVEADINGSRLDFLSTISGEVEVLFQQQKDLVII